MDSDIISPPTLLQYFYGRLKGVKGWKLLLLMYQLLFGTYNWKGLNAEKYRHSQEPPPPAPLSNFVWLPFQTELDYTPISCIIVFLLPSHFKQGISITQKIV